MGFFDGLNAAKASGRAPYITPGDYVFRIDDLKHVQGYGGNFIVGEFTVVANSGKPGECEVGTSPAWRLKHDPKYQSMFLGDIKAFLLAAHGKTDRDNFDCEAALSDALERGALKGRLIGCFAFDRPKKQKPSEMFTTYQWKPADAAAAAAASPVPAGPPEGWVANPNDPSGTWFYNPVTGEQKQFS